MADPVRYQLLFQRTIPDFVPSEESMALARASFADMAAVLARLGVVDSADLDLWTAVQMGLADQQLANEPGGDRWTATTRPSHRHVPGPCPAAPTLVAPQEAMTSRGLRNAGPLRGAVDRGERVGYRRRKKIPYSWAARLSTFVHENPRAGRNLHGGRWQSIGRAGGEHVVPGKRPDL